MHAWIKEKSHARYQICTKNISANIIVIWCITMWFWVKYLAISRNRPISIHFNPNLAPRFSKIKHKKSDQGWGMNNSFILLYSAKPRSPVRILISLLAYYHIMFTAFTRRFELIFTSTAIALLLNLYTSYPKDKLLELKIINIIILLLSFSNWQLYKKWC